VLLLAELKASAGLDPLSVYRRIDAIAIWQVGKPRRRWRLEPSPRQLRDRLAQLMDFIGLAENREVAADIGRGVQRDRGTAITPDSVAKQIEIGAGISINFLASLVGHPACNRYGMCLEAGGRLFDAFDDPGLVGRTLASQISDARGLAGREVRRAWSDEY